MGRTQRALAALAALFLVLAVGPFDVAPARAAGFTKVTVQELNSSLTLTNTQSTYESINYDNDVALTTYTWFKVVSGPNAGLTAHCPIIGNGVARWTTTSSSPGDDTVIGWFERNENPPSPAPSGCLISSGESPSNSAVVSQPIVHTWSRILLAPTYSITTVSSPGHDRSTTVVATIDNEGDADVTFTAHGSGVPDVTRTVTSANGTAQLTYARTLPGTDTISATFDSCNDGCNEDAVPVTHVWRIATDVTISPAVQTSLINDEAEFAVHATDQDGQDVSEGGVCLFVTDHDGSDDGSRDQVIGPLYFNSDSGSQELIDYTSGVPGNDDVVAAYFRDIRFNSEGSNDCPSAADAESLSTTSLQHWLPATLAPTGTSSATGVPHRLTATVYVGTAHPSAPTLDIRVVSGPGAGQHQTVPVDANGHASASFTSAVAGVSRYVANYRPTGAGEGLPASVFDSASVSHTWLGRAITLTPPTSTGDVGTTHTLTAKVVTLATSGPPRAVAGAVVVFRQRSGPSAGWPRTATTNAAGVASLTYTSTTAGTDVLYATIGTATTPISNNASRVWDLLAVIPPVVPTTPPVVVPTTTPTPPATPVPVPDTTPEPTTMPTPVPTPPSSPAPPVELGTVALELPSTLPGGEASVKGSSCPAGSTVTALIQGTSVGTATADAQGAYVVDLAVPDLPIGQYDVDIQCGPRSGKVALNLVVSTGSPFSAASAATTGLILLFLVLLLLLYVGNARTGAGRVKPTPPPDDEPWTPFPG